MHYSSKVGSVDDKVTLVPHNPHYQPDNFGQSEDLSSSDILALNYLYLCPTMRTSVVTNYINSNFERSLIHLQELDINTNEASKRCIIIQKSLAIYLSFSKLSPGRPCCTQTLSG